MTLIWVCRQTRGPYSRCSFNGVGSKSEMMRQHWSVLVRCLVSAENHDNGLSMFQITG